MPGPEDASIASACDRPGHTLFIRRLSATRATTATSDQRADVGLALFDSAVTCRTLLRKVVRSYAIDAIDRVPIP